jgi:hypothetical protein
MHLPVGLLTPFGQCLDKVVPIHIVEENVIALVATAHHVIHGTRVLDSRSTRHDNNDVK